MNFDQYLQKVKSETDKTLYKYIIAKLDEYPTPLEDWITSDLDRYLKDLDSISPNTIQKHINLLSNLRKYHCNTYNFHYERISPSSIAWEYINLGKLRSQTLTDKDYILIRNELDIIHDNQRVNIRDKVIFELAWEGLTTEQIRTLKEKDVEEISIDKIRIHLKDRVININDPIVIEDIRSLRGEIIYFRFQKDNRILRYYYRQSPNLIKPVGTRPDILSHNISNLGIIFERIMKRLSENLTVKSKNKDGSEYHLELEKISLECIKRSKIIYLFSLKNTTIEMVKLLLDKGQQNDLVWLKKFSKIIYGTKI